MQESKAKGERVLVCHKCAKSADFTEGGNGGNAKAKTLADRMAEGWASKAGAWLCPVCLKPASASKAKSKRATA